ncbi:MAG: CBS domain-containing protein [Actinomycetota bacterium]|nr:MAG: CBS domain-containing protein [Actinomycetota bacterium]
MRIERVLRNKGDEVVTIAPAASVADLLRLLTTHRIGAAVVSGDGRAIEGIASERDVVRAMDITGRDALQDTVESIMTSVVQTCTYDDTTEGLMAVMTELRVRHVPVVGPDGALAGIISIGDVVKARLGELEDERQALIDYVTQS